MDPIERSQDIYEAVPGYAPAPQPPLPAFGDYSTLEALGLKLNGFSRMVINTAMGLTGFKSFWRSLPEHIEHLQRTVNLRGPALYAQAVSATLALADDPRPLTPFQRAATLVWGVVNLGEEYFSGKLPPDMVRGQPAEMGQYGNLFGTSVVFEGSRPILYKTGVTDKIAVVVRGRFFIVDIGQPGIDATLGDLAATLEACADLAAEAEAEAEVAERTVARLTAASDMTQRRLMPVLAQRAANAEALDGLAETFVTVCLDLAAQPRDTAEASLIGHRDNIDNRWWYASLQLVVFGNARAVALCSFSAYLDGNVMMRGAAEIVRRAAAVPLPTEAGKVRAIRELHWDVGQPAYDMAERDIQLLRDPQPVATYEFAGYGQRFFEARQIEPVPAFVLALEVASRRLIGKTPLITQFQSMSRYRCTDLVTAMVTTPEVEAFVEYVTGPDPAPTRAKELLTAALAGQTAAMRDARKSLGLQTIFRLFINSDLSRRTFRGVTKRTATDLVRRTGHFQPKPREIVISFPALYSEAPIVGRPGARLPYTKYFGLHYQIWDDKTVVTFMPGVQWQKSNDELAAELAKGLELIGEVAGLAGAVAGASSTHE